MSASSSNNDKRPSRKRTCTAPTKPVYPHWNMREKKMLLSSLREFGTDNLTPLALVLKRDIDDVRSMIASIKAKAELEVANSMKQQCSSEDAPIEEWRKLLIRVIPYRYRQHDLSILVGRLLSEASKQYPNPENQHEPNFQRIYLYLSSILTCHEAPELSAIESAMILKLLQRLTQIITSLPLTKEREFLGAWHVENQYSGDPAATSSKNGVEPGAHEKAATSGDDGSENPTCSRDAGENVPADRQHPTGSGNAEDNIQTSSQHSTGSRNAEDKEPAESILNKFYASKMKDLIISVNPLNVPLDFLQEESQELKKFTSDKLITDNFSD